MTSERVWRILKPPAKIIPQRVPHQRLGSPAADDNKTTNPETTFSAKWLPHTSADR